MAEDRSSVIVVGVDESQASVAALVFGMAEAARRNSPVEAVTAWYFSNPFHLEGGPDLADDVEAQAEHVQERAITAALERMESAPAVSRKLVRGQSPADVLLEASKGAAFLVVGHMQHGAMREELHLGSVAWHCLRHATGPIVVVPHSSHVPSQDRPAHDDVAGTKAGTESG
jgi:nucleotide-binding universal stress UspA family protein